jgi:hypothetical protein
MRVINHNHTFEYKSNNVYFLKTDRIPKFLFEAHVCRIYMFEGHKFLRRKYIICSGRVGNLGLLGEHSAGIQNLTHKYKNHKINATQKIE